MIQVRGNTGKSPLAPVIYNHHSVLVILIVNNRWSCNTGSLQCKRLYWSIKFWSKVKLGDRKNRWSWMTGSIVQLRHNYNCLYSPTGFSVQSENISKKRWTLVNIQQLSSLLYFFQQQAISETKHKSRTAKYIPASTTDVLWDIKNFLLITIYLPCVLPVSG